MMAMIAIYGPQAPSGALPHLPSNRLALSNESGQQVPAFPPLVHVQSTLRTSGQWPSVRQYTGCT